MIAVIGCKSQKQDYCCSADEMYEKAFTYVAQRNFIKLAYDDYFIFSGKYGIIHHTEHICPYNVALAKNRNVTATNNVDPEFMKESANLFLENNVDKPIHFHVSGHYMKYVPKSKYNNKKWNKQQSNTGLTKMRYDEAIKSYKQNQDLKSALDIVMTPRPKNPESPQNWIHPEYGEFYGTSYELWKHSKQFQPNADQANLKSVAFGRVKSQLGWKLDKSGIRRVAMGQQPQHKGWKIC